MVVLRSLFVASSRTLTDLKLWGENSQEQVMHHISKCDQQNELFVTEFVFSILSVCMVPIIKTIILEITLRNYPVPTKKGSASCDTKVRQNAEN